MTDNRDTKFQELKSRLESPDLQDVCLIIHDQRFTTAEGHDEIDAIRTHLGERQTEIIAIPVEWLSRLYIFVPADQLARYRNGFPMVILGIAPQQIKARLRGDRSDTDIVKAAKHSLEIETFRLAGRQAGVELARNTRSRNLTDAEAENRARQIVGVAVYRGQVVPLLEVVTRLVGGLIDRGRRLAEAFFGTRFPRDRIEFEKSEVFAMKNERGAEILDDIEHENVGRVRGVAWNRERASDFSDAIENWAERRSKTKAITRKTAEKLTNALEERMTASALMKIAILGDFQPSDVHKNFLIEQDRFEVGQLIGRLSRGRTIELSAPQAKILRIALCSRAAERIESQSDSMNFLLADAALTCRSASVWLETLDRITAMGIAEEIWPETEKNFNLAI